MTDSRRPSLRSIALVGFVLHAMHPAIAASQPKADSFKETISGYRELDKTELRARWEGLEKSKDGKKLVVHARSYERKKSDEAMWGFVGKTAAGELVEVVFYDLHKRGTNESVLTMMSGRVGNKTYTAYMNFPAGVTIRTGKGRDVVTFDGVMLALEEADEWYIAADGSVKKANSWGKCFRNTVYKNCPSWCVGALAPCAAATVALAVATPPVGFATAAQLFAGCAGSICGMCLAVAAIGCF